MSQWYKKGCQIYGGDDDGVDFVPDDSELIKLWDDSMATLKEEIKARKRGETTRKEWEEGDYCRAKYDVDECWYEAKILKKLPDGRFWIQYIGYWNEQELEAIMLKPSKGEKYREAQIEECELNEYEDEYYTGEETDEEEEQLVITKELTTNGRIPEKENTQKKSGAPKAKSKQETNQKKGKGDATKVSSAWKPEESDEDSTTSETKKKSTQNRKSKTANRNAEMYPNLPANRNSEEMYPIPPTNGFEPFPDPAGLHGQHGFGYRTRESSRHPGSPEYRSNGRMEDRGTHAPLPESLPRRFVPPPLAPGIDEPFRTVVVPISEPPFYRIEKQVVLYPAAPSMNSPPSGPRRYGNQMNYSTSDYPTSFSPPPPPATHLRRDQSGPFVKPNFPQAPSQHGTGQRDYGHPSGYSSESFLPRFFPPPPPLSDAVESTPEMQSLMSMLNAWYVSGYQTGHYVGLKEAQQRMRGSRNHS